MLYVYLDQNKWIDLARVAKGDDRGKPFSDVLTVAEEAAKQGFAGFPLSSIHYMEIYNTRSFQRRQDVAGVMLRLARPGMTEGPLTIAGAPDLLRCEIDAALRRWFGKPFHPRTYPVFDHGVGHAFGRPELDTTPLGVEFGLSAPLRFTIKRMMQEALLTGPPDPSSVPGMNAQAHQPVSIRYMQGDETLARQLQKSGLSKAARHNALAGLSVIDILEPLNEALARAGITIQKSTELETADGLTKLLKDIPTAHVDYELKRLRHDNPSLQRKRGDLDDIAALTVAVVHCDVVVTEKLWVDLIRRSKLDVQYNTTVLHDLRELLPILVALIRT